MKKNLLLISLTSTLLSGLVSAGNQVVMTINGEPVDRSEFEYLWHKNSGVSADTLTVREYADMFALFKMKVAAAEAAGIDTTKAFLKEWKGYRSQLTPAYLTDKEAERKVLEEAYHMVTTYADASHILILTGPYAEPADTLEAYSKIVGIHKRATGKKADFAALAREYSQDGSKEDGGYLGTNIVGRYIYPFAKTLMQLKEGEISRPFRSQFGYHIIQLNRRFEAPGKIVSGHIFKSAPESAGAEASARAEQAIRAIYAELQAGADFTAIAVSEQNDDQYLRTNGGVYPPMAPGEMPYEYEQAVYDLKDGDCSEPFHTAFGWHIVKRISIQPLDDMKALETELKMLISQDNRSNAGKDGLVSRLKQEYGYSLDEKAFQAFCRAVEAHGAFDNALVDKVSPMDHLATFHDNAITAADFGRYLTRGTHHLHYLRESFDKYVGNRILSYEDSRLEEKYPDFGNLMREYHDGLLLFEISSREVWDKASSDTEGREAFFETHRDRYTWDKPRYKGAVIYCSDKKTASKVRKAASGLEADSLSAVLYRTFNTDSVKVVKVERGLFAKGEKPVIDRLAFKQGDWQAEEDFPYVWLQGSVITAPQEAADVRGPVTADYQQYLEDQWAAKLRELYPVRFNEEVINSIQ